jgi:uncharacterized protein YjiS (DUF1127 family)
MRTCVATVAPLHLGRSADAKLIMDSIAPGESRSAVEGMVATWRRALAERRVRATLAEMDERLLVDIGIAPDEVARVRVRERFTPRAWLMRRRRVA